MSRTVLTAPLMAVRGVRRSCETELRASCEALGFGVDLGGLRLLGQARPLDSQGGLIGEGLQLVQTLGRVELVGRAGPDAEHPDRSARRHEGDIERPSPGQGRGPQAGGMMMLVDPAGDGDLVGVHVELRPAPGGQTAVSVRQERDDLTAKDAR